MIYVNKVVKYKKPRIEIATPKAVEEKTAPVPEKEQVQEKTESRRGRKPKNEQ